jgi:hypothetical protein
VGEIYEVVGMAIGESSHLAATGGVITLCGIACAKWLRKRFFLQRQVNCKDCRNEYLESHGKERLR